MMSRATLVMQLLLTLLIVGWPMPNVIKLASLLVVWALTFRRISRAELLLASLVCLLFIVMNSAALAQGIFSFAHPDLLGMPAYEFVMWGFYVLHVRRVVGGVLAPPPSRWVWLLTLLYMAAFASITDSVLLLSVTGTLLVVALFLHHEPLDLAYFGYMVLLGAAVEYTGVWRGEWHYPGDPPGGVPLWFITLWGGVGYFLRRLALPLVHRRVGRPTSSQ